MPKAYDTTDPDIVEIREAREYDENGWADQREEGRKDALICAGKVWEALDPKGQRQRVDAKRPFLAPDVESQYQNQVINEFRQNPRGVKFSPRGDGATDKTAEFYANKMREVEYRSHAQIHYSNALQNAVQRGMGWVRVKSEVVSPASFQQELCIDGFPNPDMVLPDCHILMPDASDMQHCHVYEDWSQRKFKAKFPKAKIVNFHDYASANPLWVTGENVTVAEFWKISTRLRKLLLIQPPAVAAPPSQLGIRPPIQSPPYAMFEDDPKLLQRMQPGSRVLRTEERDFPMVTCQWTNGLEILKTINWPGRYIPLAACMGKVIFTEDGRQVLSMTRLARDPIMFHCYIVTCIAEAIGGVPRASYKGYVGQFKTDYESIQEAAHVPKAFIQFDAKTEETGEQILPIPEREPWDPPVQNLLAIDEAAQRLVRDAQGSSFLPPDAQRRNDKSGVALDKIKQTSQQGTFHFADHANLMVERVGIICEDLIPFTYDTTGSTGTMDAQGNAIPVRINDPLSDTSISTQGDHLVTVSVGPSNDSEREAVADYLETLLGSPAVTSMGPQVIGKLIAQGARMQNLGTGGDHLAEIFDPTPVDGQPSPQMLQSQLGQAATQIKQISQQRDQAMQALATEQPKIDSNERIAKYKEDQTTMRLEKELAAKIEVARISASKQAADPVAEALEERLAVNIDQTHDVRMAQIDHANTMAESAQEHAQTVAEANQAHQHALVQGAQPPPVDPNAAPDAAAPPSGEMPS